ncbi:MAG: hypothetical protein C0602_03465 [Denitrovibrio sp.]|nr:MAG: hypothetical protein C0602_03465 [Denitrovibrio sp.]
MGIIRWVVTLLCFVPLGDAVYQVFYNYEIADPVKFLTKQTGVWAIVFMLLTLSITPLRKITRKQWLFPYRAIFGRIFFLYVFCHAVVFIALANTFNPSDIILSIKKSKPIIFGLIALLMLIPMMATTGHYMIKKLGHVKWRRVHSMIYPASIFAALHYLTVVKKDIRLPLVASVFVLVLLGFRLYRHYSSKKQV